MVFNLYDALREGKVKSAWPTAPATWQEVQQGGGCDHSDHTELDDSGKQRSSGDKRGFCDTSDHCTNKDFETPSDSGHKSEAVAGQQGGPGWSDHRGSSI